MKEQQIIDSAIMATGCRKDHVEEALERILADGFSGRTAYNRLLKVLA